LQRKLLSLGNDAVGYLVRVRLALAAFLSLRPAAEPSVGACGLGLSSGLRAAKQRTNVYFVSTMRAFHFPQLTTPNTYDSCTNSK
jgi:hypothetical protein